MTVPEILDELTDHGFEDTDLDRKVEIIQAVIWDAEGRKAWPFLEKALNLNFDGISSVPSNFPADLRAALRLRDLTLNRRIMPLRLDDAEDRMGKNDAESGDPSFYYFEGSQLKVWRVPPSATARMKFRYIRWSDEITAVTVESGILIPKQFHRSVIVNGSLAALYEMEDDPEISSRYDARYEGGLERMEAAVFPQQFDRHDHIHVLDPDDWDYDVFV